MEWISTDDGTLINVRHIVWIKFIMEVKIDTGIRYEYKIGITDKISSDWRLSSIRQTDTLNAVKGHFIYVDKKTHEYLESMMNNDE